MVRHAFPLRIVVGVRMFEVLALLQAAGVTGSWPGDGLNKEREPLGG
jgi:hypothetical protein